MTSVRRRILTLVAAAAVAAVPSQAGGQELPEFTGDEFNDLFTTATLENLAPVGPAPSITGNATTDQHIRDIGEDRGYVRRPLPNGPLTSVSGLMMQPTAVDAWIALRDAAKAAGHTLLLRSTYRSHSTQTIILLRRLYSFSDSAINYGSGQSLCPGTRSTTPGMRSISPSPAMRSQVSSTRRHTNG